MKQEDDGGSKLRVWVANVETGKARPLFQSPDVFLNAVFDKYGSFSIQVEKWASWPGWVTG